MKPSMVEEALPAEVIEPLRVAPVKPIPVADDTVTVGDEIAVVLEIVPTSNCELSDPTPRLIFVPFVDAVMLCQLSVPAPVCSSQVLPRSVEVNTFPATWPDVVSWAAAITLVVLDAAELIAYQPPTPADVDVLHVLPLSVEIKILDGILKPEGTAANTTFAPFTNEVRPDQS